MAVQVWKFRLTSTNQQVEMPLGGKVIHVGEQEDSICVWAIVQPAQAAVTRRFIVKGTGWDIPDLASYHGTVQASNGTVWHVFEVIDGDG